MPLFKFKNEHLYDINDVKLYIIRHLTQQYIFPLRILVKYNCFEAESCQTKDRCIQLRIIYISVQTADFGQIERLGDRERGWERKKYIQQRL